MTGGTGNRGKGRPKGARNKVTGAVKDMVLTALGNVGGAKYLERQANENPTAFMSLLGRVLPLQIAGDPDGDPIRVSRIELSAPLLNATAEQYVNGHGEHAKD